LHEGFFSSFSHFLHFDLYRSHISHFTFSQIIAPIPDAYFDDDAKSDGTSDELIVVDDEDDIDDEEEEFAIPIDGMFIINLMGLVIVPGAIPSMLGSNGAGVFESDADGDAAAGGNEAPFRVPHLLALNIIIPTCVA